jgi:DEAD/DEAH box helicase domain-containing protein
MLIFFHRQILLWNPPIIFRGSSGCAEAELQEMDDSNYVDEFSPANRKSQFPAFRRNALGEISRLLAVLMAAGKRTIAFAKSRRSAEFLLERTKAAIVELGLPSHLQSLVASYRGGYEKSDRRDIEMRLRRGDLLAVVATNALELGIDVGGLDATLHLGVPPSIASLRQQIGRCGRAGRESISIVVCTNAPTDQFVARQPGSVFTQKYDFSYLNCNERTILIRHLLCAAAELPISPGDPFEAGLWGDALSDSLDHLMRSRRLTRGPQGCVLDPAASSSTSARFSIRAMDEENFKIVDDSTKCVIDNIAFSRIFFEVFEGAIYLNQGRLYRVRCLDFKSKIALLEPLSKMPNYFVKLNDSTDVKTHSVQCARAFGECPTHEDRISSSVTCPAAPAPICFGKVDVVKAAWRISKVERVSGRVIGEQDLTMPPLVYSTSAVWIGVTSGIIARLNESDALFDLAGAVHAAYHALAAAAEIVVRCSPRDIECLHTVDASKPLSELVLFDGQAGGTGVSRQIYSHMDDIIRTAIKILEDCSCRSLAAADRSLEQGGCLECVLSLRCPAGNRGVHRRHGLCFLKCIAGLNN